MKRVWIVIISLLVYIALVVGASYLLHMEGKRFLLFNLLLILLGMAAAAVAIWYFKKVLPAPAEAAGSAETGMLDSLIRDADSKLKQANRPGVKSLASLPLVYVIGDENSAKTQTILQAGLDPELLAGQVYRDSAVVPTPVANIWLSGTSAIVEAGGALLRQPALWQRLVRLTAPGKLSTALSKNALQPTRAVMLCVSMERIMAPSTTEQIRALGQMMNERLRQLSQTLGISLPVYVLFTKLDTVTAFAEYAANLTENEVTTPVGAMLSNYSAGAGLYADRAATQIGTRFDEVAYLLSEFRLEVLARGGQEGALARSYEFPRDLRKLRSGIVEFLVEVGRPSQLGVNPFLRGFFFSGMRAHLVENVLSVSAQPSAPIMPAANAGATQVFTFSQIAAQQQAPVPSGGAMRKVAQWVFLPYLFSRLVLTDKTALESSRVSTRVSSTKRVLVACLCGLLLAYLSLLTISFFRNNDLEKRAATAAKDVRPVGRTEVASVSDLQSLDALRAVLVELDGYHKDGPPLMDRWGIYRGEEIRQQACIAYGQRFNKLLLAQTQGNITAKLTALPVKAAPTDEYQATYKPLKAWLITTSNPEKSSTDFLPGVLDTEWVANRPVSDEAKQLAHNQFDYYASVLPEPQSCLAKATTSRPDSGLVASTRGYLNSFSGFDHVYLSMKAAADRRFPPIDFKKLYPASVKYVSAPVIVDGSFSKEGFTFMEDAINHPDAYLSGEEWVTGPSTATIDKSTLHQQLQTRYNTDFTGAWRNFIKAAHVLPFGSQADSVARLHELDGPGSPLLAIFGVISRNTAVADQTFSAPFQSAQSVVAPGNGPYVNPGYTGKLSGIEDATNQMINSKSDDPSGVNSAVAAAYGQVSTMRAAFQPPDPAGIVDASAERLLREPIKGPEDLAGKAQGKAAGGAAGDMCKAANNVLGKFPFNPDAKQDASPEEAATLFGSSGAIAQFASSQTKFVSFNGSVYSSTGAAPVNPALLAFLNATHTLDVMLFPNNSTQPQFSFTIAQLATPNLGAATVDIDGTSSSAIGSPLRVNWKYSTQGAIKLAGSGQTKSTFGPWSIFHFAYQAKHPGPNQLEYIFQNNGVTEKSQSGVDIIYRFDVEDSGARLLNPDFMRHNLRCVASVLK